MRRRRRITTDHLLLAGLAVGLVVAFAAGFAAREFLGSTSTIKSIIPRITLEDLLARRSLDWPFALDGGVLVEAFDGVVFADTDLDATLQAEPADPLAVASTLVAVLAEEADRQSALASDVAAARESLEAADGGDDKAADLLWIQEAHSRLAEDLAAAVQRVEEDGAGLGVKDLSRLAQAASGGPGAPDAEMQRFAGTVTLGATRLSPDEAVDRLLAHEASTSLAKRAVAGNNPSLRRALYGELKALARRKNNLGAEGWAQVRTQTVDRVIREAAETLSRRRTDGLILCTLTVQDWQLASGSTDMTLTVEGSSILGFFGGVYTSTEESGRAIVSGSFQGTIRDDRMIEGSGEYELDERTESGRLIEKGEVSVAGLRTRTGDYLGSITLRPVEPIGTRRQILWRSLASRD